MERVQQHEYGYRIEVRFLDREWTPELFKPAHLTDLTQIVVKSPATAAVYVSGGVPKNYINDSIVMSYIFGLDTGGHKYALQVTTDAPHWGGLGGSTLSEATSWGKVSKTATHQMAFVETSVALPLLYGYALQKNAAKGRTRLKYSWREDILERVSRS